MDSTILGELSLAWVRNVVEQEQGSTMISASVSTSRSLP